MASKWPNPGKNLPEPNPGSFYSKRDPNIYPLIYALFISAVLIWFVVLIRFAMANPAVGGC